MQVPSFVILRPVFISTYVLWKNRRFEHLPWLLILCKYNWRADLLKPQTSGHQFRLQPQHKLKPATLWRPSTVSICWNPLNNWFLSIHSLKAHGYDLFNIIPHLSMNVCRNEGQENEEQILFIFVLGRFGAISKSRFTWSTQNRGTVILPRIAMPTISHIPR